MYKILEKLSINSGSISMFVWGRVVKIWLFWFFLYSSYFNYLYHIIGVDKIVISCLQLNKDKIYQYENSPTNVLLQWLLFPLINYNSSKVHFLSFSSSLFSSHSLFEFYTVLLTSFLFVLIIQFDLLKLKR